MEVKGWIRVEHKSLKYSGWNLDYRENSIVIVDRNEKNLLKLGLIKRCGWSYLCQLIEPIQYSILIKVTCLYFLRYWCKQLNGDRLTVQEKVLGTNVNY